jgi:hypothetical protein
LDNGYLKTTPFSIEGAPDQSGRMIGLRLMFRFSGAPGALRLSVPFVAELIMCFSVFVFLREREPEINHSLQSDYHSGTVLSSIYCARDSAEPFADECVLMAIDRDYPYYSRFFSSSDQLLQSINNTFRWRLFSQQCPLPLPIGNGTGARDTRSREHFCGRDHRAKNGYPQIRA